MRVQWAFHPGKQKLSVWNPKTSEAHRFYRSDLQMGVRIHTTNAERVPFKMRRCRISWADSTGLPAAVAASRTTKRVTVFHVSSRCCKVLLQFFEVVHMCCLRGFASASPRSWAILSCSFWHSALHCSKSLILQHQTPYVKTTRLYSIYKRTNILRSLLLASFYDYDCL